MASSPKVILRSAIELIRARRYKAAEDILNDAIASGVFIGKLKKHAERLWKIAHNRGLVGSPLSGPKRGKKLAEEWIRSAEEVAPPASNTIGPREIQQISEHALGKCGAYAIRNVLNGKVYIGSSTDIGRRWQQHIANLKNGEHKAERLQKDFDKFGWENFEFSVLREDIPQDELASVEEQIIQSEKALGDFGYNTSPIGWRPDVSWEERLYEIYTGRVKSRIAPLPIPPKAEIDLYERRLKRSRLTFGLLAKPMDPRVVVRQEHDAAVRKAEEEVLEDFVRELREGKLNLPIKACEPQEVRKALERARLREGGPKHRGAANKKGPKATPRRVNRMRGAPGGC